MYAIILAGGSGSRLWPWTGEDTPKQLFSLEENGINLFQETLIRIKNFVPPEKTIIVTNKSQAGILRENAQKISGRDCVFLEEPVGKNTAPAVGLGLFYLFYKDPEGIIAVLPSDHIISPREKMIELIKLAATKTREHGIVVFGFEPDRAESGYGYIKTGANLSRHTFKVDRFVEKPDSEKARSYIREGKYLWNSGMFVFRTRDMVREYQKYLPELAELLAKIDFQSFKNIEQIYSQINGISFDIGIMEKTERSVVIKSDISWNDMGDWKAVYDLLPKDQQKNQIRGNVYTLGTQKSLLWGKDRFVGVIGLENLILIDTDQALLVCDQKKAQEVKKLVAQMEKDKKKDNKTPCPKNEDPDAGERRIQDLFKTYEQEKWIDNLKKWLEDPCWGKIIHEEIERMEYPEVLKDNFRKNLDFGTGGLRGPSGFGPNRFNKQVVRRTTQGLSNYLNNKQGEQKIGVVIGYDTRINSRNYAQEVARVLAENNIKALLFEEPFPTPLISFATRQLKCQAGVMITGSHNPVNHNGYKIYSADGVQILPEQAEEIAQEIEKVDFFQDIETSTMEKSLENGQIEFIGEEISSEYIGGLRSLYKGLQAGVRDIKIVFSPLHGNANHLVRRTLKEDGFEGVFPVSRQVSPNPEKAVVASLNPEEREAYDIALIEARKVEADIILATDLDGDRLGCMIRKGPGDYVLLSGNQVGALLVDYYLHQLQKANSLPPNGVIVKTIVTGELGERVARNYNRATINTLTGFKFIGEKINEFEEKGNYKFLLGYEESCGYLAGSLVRDKDAVGSALLIARMADWLKGQGSSLNQRLEELQQKFGYYQEELQRINLEGNEGGKKKEKIMSGFRKTWETWDDWARQKVIEVRDYRMGKGFSFEKNQHFDLDLPVADVLYFRMIEDSWFCIRPSGTEPLLKVYFSVKGSCKEDARKKLEALRVNVLERVSFFSGG